MFSKYVAVWSFKDGRLDFYDTGVFLQSKSELGISKPELSLTYNGFINKEGDHISFDDPFEAEQFRDDIERNFVLFFNGTFYHNTLIDDGCQKTLDFSGTLAFSFMQAELILDDLQVQTLSNVMPTFKKNWLELLGYITEQDKVIDNVLSFTLV